MHAAVFLVLVLTVVVHTTLYVSRDGAGGSGDRRSSSSYRDGDGGGRDSRDSRDSRGPPAGPPAVSAFAKRFGTTDFQREDDFSRRDDDRYSLTFNFHTIMYVYIC
jgi:hypothetical protein